MLFRTFLVVAETGSFTTAADRLCVTQSAVSRRVRQLEEQYDVQLLDRSGETVSPTPAGTLVLQKARQILAVESEMEEGVATLARRQRLRFCCTPCFGTGVLLRVLERFVAAEGMACDFNINFLLPEEILTGLRHGSIQFAVVEHCDDLDVEGLPHHHLPDDVMLFASAPPLGLENEILTLEDLARFPLYLKTPHGCAYRFIASGLEKLGHRMEDLPYLNYYDDIPGLISQVVGGAGVGFLSRTLISGEIARGDLQIHRLEGLNPHRQRTLVLSPRLNASASVPIFARAIFEELGSTVPQEFDVSSLASPGQD